MSERAYHTDDCIFSVPPGFTDRSAQILEWPTPGGGSVVLIVQREKLKPPMSLQTYVEAATRDHARQFPGYFPEAPTDLVIEAEADVVRIAFRWKGDQGALFHGQAFVSTGARVILFTATGKAQDRDQIEAVLDRALESLKFREA